MSRAAIASAVAAAIAIGTGIGALILMRGPTDVEGRATCTLYLGPDAQAALDAGPYGRLSLPALQHEDGGYSTGGWPEGATVVSEDLCDFEEQDGALDGGLLVVPFECACSSGQDCQAPTYAPPTWELVWAAAPLGTTLSPGQFDGGGCAPKTCRVLAGMDEAWPPGCPL
jgi:hypothetical protein